LLQAKPLEGSKERKFNTVSFFPVIRPLA